MINELSDKEPLGSSTSYLGPFYRWYVVSLLGVAFAVSYIDRLIITLMVDPIKADLALSDTQVSLLIGLSFAVFYTTSAIPIAWLADRYSRRNIIVGGITIWCLMTTACGFVKSFPGLFIARMGVGFGEAALAPASSSLIADTFPKEQLGKALGVVASGIAIGAGLAMVIGGQVLAWIGPSTAYELPIVGSMLGWQLTFVILGLGGLVLAVVMFSIKEPARQHEGASAAESAKVPNASIAETINFFLEHKKVYLTLYVGFAAAQTSFYAMGAWIPSLFTRVFKWDIGTFGTTYGIVLAVMGIVGVSAGGWACDKLYKNGVKDAHWRVVIYAFALIPVYLLIPFFADGKIVMAILAFGNLASFAAATAGPAAILMITPNIYRAMATALFFFTINIIGMILGPLLVALLTEKVFQDPNSIATALAIVSGVAWLIATVILIYGLKFYRARLIELKI